MNLSPNFKKGLLVGGVLAALALTYKLTKRNEPEAEVQEKTGEKLVKAALSPDQQAKKEIMREMAKKGGKKSAETRRAKKQAAEPKPSE